ncbi:MAG TPA: ABC transporter ATP-binding protein [Candidatus Altiarchaeales archaeon]|nr:ABC transporter ATP-binding protein [Candidatus Altiarchaeales archaeon]
MSILEIQDLTVEVDGGKILSKINFNVGSGANLLFGPNGSGKTTLLMTILGIPGYKVTCGKIIFNGEDITKLEVDGRARLGIGYGFQQPPEVYGVKLKDLLKVCEGKSQHDKLSDNALALVEKLRMSEFLDREVNVGFSGGEKKRAEALQLLLMRPKLMLLDEPDSGVDIDSLAIIAREIQKYLDESGASALIITHQGHILEHIEAKNACVLMDGENHCYGDAHEIFNDIKEKGYRGCVECQKRKTIQNNRG